MSWQLKEKMQQILAKEQGATVYAPGSRTGFALAYPNTYHVGMSNLGFQIIYQQINSRADTACERIFLPEKKVESEYVRTRTPLMTLETQRPLYTFPLIGVAMTFEMDYFNLLRMLELGRVPLLAADRGETDPIVILGGPCATFNPEPLAEFVDVCVIGEGEEVIHELLDVYYAGQEKRLTRNEVLASFAAIQGLYVPSLYNHSYHADGTLAAISPAPAAPEQVERRWIKNLDDYPAHTVVVTNDTEFNNLYLLEVARGCGRHCRFCMAGYCYRRPRSRSLDKLKPFVMEAKRFGCKAGLMGAAISDYPAIDELCDYIRAQDIGMSVASLRADSLSPVLVNALAASGQRTITLAPEAASESMRQVINKGITDEHLFRSIDMAVQAGIVNVRLYIMVGLPFETEQDVAAIPEMALQVKRHMEQQGSTGKLTLSINPFIPKPFTPFQWVPMDDQKTVEKKLSLIQAALKGHKQIEVLVENPREAYIQGILARGDRRLAQVLLAAHHHGGAKGWKKAVKELAINETFYLYRVRKVDEILPWTTLAMGFAFHYLVRELDNAKARKSTAQCTLGCKRCGVC